MYARIKRFLREEDGPTAVEYAVMLALILMVALAAINEMGQATADSFNTSSSSIEAAMNP